MINTNLDGYNYKTDCFRIYGNGSIHFKFPKFKFFKDYDISSLFWEDEVLFE